MGVQFRMMLAEALLQAIVKIVPTSHPQGLSLLKHIHDYGVEVLNSHEMQNLRLRRPEWFKGKEA